MDPVGPIQQIPRGLIGLLQLKSRGQMPDVLLGNVQPTVDLLEMWLQAGAAGDTVLHAISLPDGSDGWRAFSPNPITVPQAEIWYVHGYTVRAVIGVGAGEVVSYLAPAIGVQLVGTLQVQALAPPQSFSGLAAADTNGWVSARGFWLGPGQSLGFLVGNVATGGTVTFVGEVYATRMPIP